MNKKINLNLWNQIFLMQKYLNFHLRKKVLKDIDITPYELFFLGLLSHYENLTFYEINKYMPFDVKTLHLKITSFVKRGYLTRKFDNEGTSFINLSKKSWDYLNKTKKINSNLSKNPFGINNFNNLGIILNSFNDEMRKVLHLEPTTDLDSKKISFPNDFSLWIQIFLTYRYFHEYLRDGVLKKYNLSTTEYFLISTISEFQNLTFYEINKYLPLDKKFLRENISTLIKKKWIKKVVFSNGKSQLNIVKDMEKPLLQIEKENAEGLNECFFFIQELPLLNELIFFNNKMRASLGISLKKSILKKLKRS